jgi:hypothetical protein
MSDMIILDSASSFANGNCVGLHSTFSCYMSSIPRVAY